jgi:uncharacterized membrane protein
MNLINIIYEPYVIIIFISIILTIISYFIVQNDNKNKPEEQKTNLGKALFLTFIISFIIMMVLKYSMNYMNKNKIFQKEGGNINEKLTIVADDVDFGILEN